MAQAQALYPGFPLIRNGKQCENRQKRIHFRQEGTRTFRTGSTALPTAARSAAAVKCKIFCGRTGRQCKAATDTGKNFFEQPVHCQNSQIENAVSYSGLFSLKTEYNVKFIQPTDSPIRDFSLPNSAADRAMAYATRATAKKTGGVDNDDDLPPLATVEINDDSIPDFVDASQSGKPEPLNEEENKKLQKKIDIIKNKRLKNNTCKEFLESRGISIPDFIKTLDTHNRYSARRSKDITAEQAGFYSPASIIEAKSLPEGSERTRLLGYLNQPVNEYIESVRKGFGENADLGGIIAPYAFSPTVYYDDFDEESTFHESLHLSTGKDDKDLAFQLTGKTFKSVGSASEAITNILKDKKCVK